MRSVDLTPLMRATVGFDRMMNLLDAQTRHDQGDGYPPYNIEKTGDDDYRITMAVAGFGEDDLDVTVKENSLTIKGKKPNGERNDGIDLAVPEGTEVKAAESGVVIYAGSELKSYGNLVLVKHENGWVSAYAHNKELLVKRGDQVQRGQVISKAGRSGGVDTPQVHFELRKGATPVDPMKYLSPS